MKVLRSLGYLVVFVAVAVAAGYGASNLHDGPLGMMSGGPLRAGPWATDAVPNVRFAHDLDTVEFQLLSPPRSRTTWIVEVDGRLYIVSGYMNGTLGKLWKHWPYQAERDGRAVLRMNGTRYPRELVRVMGGPTLPTVLDELNRKYRMQATQDTVASGDLWVFEARPRALSVDERISGISP